MNIRTVVGFTALLTIASAVPASAEPPAGSTCVSGYNPDAVLNVCHVPGEETEVGPFGGVKSERMEVCPIGGICQSVPVPGYDPDGGKEHKVPGVPDPVYIEVLGTGYEVRTPTPQELAWCFHDPPAWKDPMLDYAVDGAACAIGQVLPEE